MKNAFDYVSAMMQLAIHNTNSLLCSGTYFNCIMFMVASSVVTTIMILNYHHRLADTHEMPDWVSDQCEASIIGLIHTYTYPIHTSSVLYKNYSLGN